MGTLKVRGRLGGGMSLLAVGGVLATTALLGVTHAVEPDHVAGITALTSDAGSPRRSALVGAAFGTGHTSLVVVWVALGYVMLGTTTFPTAFVHLGTLALGVVLAVLGGVMGALGLRTLIRSDEHYHAAADVRHSHPVLSIPGLRSVRARSDHDHDHGPRALLELGVVGALFTLSPPLSMLAFVSSVLPTVPAESLVLVVLVYAAAITGTMSLVGSGVGWVFGALRGGSERLHAWSRVVTAVFVTAFGLSLLWGTLVALA